MREGGDEGPPASPSVAERMAAVDWAAHPWGAQDTWPAGLRAPVDLLLRSRFPMFLAWGPDLRLVYNDAYARILGAKHPAALGEPFDEVWSDVWPVVGPMAREVVGDRPVFAEDLQLGTHRRGFLEETYFTFSYSPVGGPDGTGVFCAVTETTGRVVGERRLRALRELGEAAPVGAGQADACAAAVRVLDDHRADVPFAMAYLLDTQGSTGKGADRRAGGPARLVATSGLVPGAPLAPRVLPAADRGAQPDPGTESFLDVLATGRPAVVAGLAARHPGSVLPGASTLGDALPDTVLVLPLTTGTQDRPTGLVVLAVSPHLALDAGYRGFLELVAQQVSRAVASAGAYETQRRRAEELAELDRAKTAFFTNISHEFRTPLTLMLGPVEQLLADPDLGARVRTELDPVRRNGLRLTRLVTTLLDVAQLQAGRSAARFEPVDLAAATAELAGLFRAALERAGLRLDVDCPGLGEPVLVDRGMWEQIVLNLLSNALKFTFEGAVTVRLRREEAAAGEPRAVLRVTDTGTGIPADELPRLFERFHRVEGARARSAEGSGIGLALVTELVGLHGGTISAESTPGHGSVFTVSLPLGRAHLPADQVVPGSAPAADPAGAAQPFLAEALRWLPGRDDGPTGPAGEHADGRVLVVDDNADMREHLARLLADRYEVQTAPDGVAALQAAHDDPPDLVLSDVMMPRLDGAALVAALRADPVTAAVPVVLLSARTGDEAIADGLAAGADDYLVKPFSAVELRARVAGHLRLSRMRRELAEREQAALRTQELLQRATAEFSAAATPQQVAGVTVAHLGALLGTQAVAVWQLHGEDLLEQLDLGGWGTRVKAGWASLPVDDTSPAGDAALRREAVWVESEDDWHRLYPRLLPTVRGHGYPTVGCLPLLAGGRCLGVVAIGLVEEHRLGPGERSAALALLDQAAQALQRAALLAAESDARRAAEEFGRTVAALSAATTPAEVSEVALGLATGLGAESAVVVVREGEQVDRLGVLAARGAASRDARLPLDAAHPLAHAVRTGEAVWTGSRPERAWRHGRSGDAGPDLPGQIVLPMLVGGTAIGAVGMHFGSDAGSDTGSDTDTGADPDVPVIGPDRRATLLTIAGQCAQALDRARLHQVEHEVAETLQRSLLPRELPRLARVAATARYLPSAEDLRAGGDWYDLQAIDDTRVALAIGDVVGHGAAAAAVMGQLRSALAGYLLDGHGPADALERLDRFASRIAGATGSTCACLVLDWTSGELRWASAGHPPALLVRPGAARFVEGGAGTALGVRGRPPYREARSRIDPGTSVVLYTDGLVERRAETIDAGLHRLRDLAADDGGRGPDELLEHLVAGMVGPGAPTDDVALVVVRLVPEQLSVQLPAAPSSLRRLRRAVAAWADEAGLTTQLTDDLQFVMGEAAANAIEHAYPTGDGGTPSDGTADFTAAVTRSGDGGAQIAVRDHGRWRPEPSDPGHRGHGLRVMRRLTEDFTVDADGDGTTVQMRLPPPIVAGPTVSRPHAASATALERDRPGQGTTGGPQRLRVIGDLDHEGVPAVRAGLLSALAGSSGAVLDLTAVGYVSSAGIGLIAQAAAAAPDLEVRVVPGSPAARILSLAGIDRVLTVR